MRRAGFYIDGFNFYHAIAELGRGELKWISYQKLCHSIIRQNETLAFSKFFSALAHHIPASRARHEEFLRVMSTEQTEIVLGTFKRKSCHCKLCRKRYQAHEEKETDVKIAIHLLNDCWQGSMDVAYLLTTDSDMAPVVKMCRRLFPQIEIVSVATSWRRHSKEILALYGGLKTTVTEGMIEQCLYPQKVLDSGGIVIATRPPEYDPPARARPTSRP